MNEDALPKMKTLFGSPLPALSPSDGERVASGRVRGNFTLEDRLGGADPSRPNHPRCFCNVCSANISTNSEIPNAIFSMKSQIMRRAAVLLSLAIPCAGLFQI